MVDAQIQASLKGMYELGVAHGRVLAEKEAQLNQLKKEVEELKQQKEQINE